MKPDLPKRLWIIFGALITLCQCNIAENNTYEISEHWERAIPNQQIPIGLTSLSASACGSCHQSHYEEWKISTHAHAWTDLQFQAELLKESSPYFCINCHTPLQNQQEYVITDLIDGDLYQPVKEINPSFDRELQQEGINCATCHVRNGFVIGSTKPGKAPHKSVQDSLFLSQKLCLSCHNANAVVTSTLICAFETGMELEAGPYSSRETCISCHMKTTTREIAPGFGERMSHLHFIPGSGIPKFDTVNTRTLNGLVFYPSTPKKEYSLDEKIRFTLDVKNENAGHKVPTGDPERYFHIIFKIVDEQGTLLHTTTEKIGEEWQWYPVAKKISDNNIGPDELLSFSFSYIPVERGKFTLDVEITKNRLDKESADYNKLDDKYPLFITVYSKIIPFEVI